MKSKNDVSECIHCHVCQKHCEFLKKYGIDIGDTEKLKELSYHCFLCGKCTEVCPIGIEGLYSKASPGKCQGGRRDISRKRVWNALKRKERLYL